MATLLSATISKTPPFGFGTGVVTNATSFTVQPPISLRGQLYAFLVRCEVTESLADGLDSRGSQFSVIVSGVTVTYKVQPHILEDRCRMYHCGLHPSWTNNSNQASTMHDGARAMRIGSEYGLTGGPNTQDVYLSTTGQQSYAVFAGCYAYLSMPSAQSNRFGIRMGGANVNTDKSIAWILEQRFADPFGNWPVSDGHWISAKEQTTVAYDAAYTIGAGLNIVKDGTAFARPTLVIPFRYWRRP